MTPELAIERINEVQRILNDVYFIYGNPDTELGRSLSVADTCLEEALEDLITLQIQNEIG